MGVKGTSGNFCSEYVVLYTLVMIKSKETFVGKPFTIYTETSIWIIYAYLVIVLKKIGFSHYRSV